MEMGIKSPLDETPSLALGSSDVNLLELVNAYCTVSNNGMHHEPVLVTKILDKDGEEVYLGPSDSQQVIPYKSAFLMQQMLQGGMREPGGTSQSLWGYVGNYGDTEFGGKTGTSNNHSDAWFVGVSPKMVCGAWVGGEYRSIHFRTGALGQGSRTALPICGYFLESLLGDPAFKQYHGKFDKPKDSSITPDMYENCRYVYTPRDTDSISTDSLGMQLEEEEIIIDENGNPVVKLREREPQEAQPEKPNSHEENNGEATEPKKKAQPQYEDVYF
jgi:penicillin-binding protein 1A